MKAGHHFGDPDDAEHSKALALVKYAEYMTKILGCLGGKSDVGLGDITEPEEIFWWIECVGREGEPRRLP